MKLQLQKLIIEYLLSSNEIFIRCNNIIKAEYFDPEFQNTVTFIKEYFLKYNSLPPYPLIEAETNFKPIEQNITKDIIAYTLEEIEQFCIQQAVMNIVLTSEPLIQDENYSELVQKLSDAISITMDTDVGMDYFLNPTKRIATTSVQIQRLSTGWIEVDRHLDGGLLKGEMLLFTANSGGGKSFALANLGLNLYEKSQHVLYISLELSERLISQRYDNMVTGISASQASIHIEKMGEIIENKSIKNEGGSLVIKRMSSGATTIGIRAYLKEYELKYGFIPDAILVDYIDLMAPNSTESYSNLSEKDQMISQELYDLGVEYDMYMISASQQNRCLSLDSKLITNVGRKKIKNVKLGDKVFNGVCYNTVTAIAPISIQVAYKITLRNGKTIICGGNHLHPIGKSGKLKSINTGLKVMDMMQCIN